MASGWSDLPTELLNIGPAYYAQFGVVCTSWKSAVCLCRKNISQLPVLVFPNTSFKSSTFFSFSTRNYHTLKRQESIPCGCYGSSHGWLLTKDEDSYDVSNFKLVNRFLSVDNVIELPPLLANSIQKGVLSDNPAWTSDYAIMIIYNYDRSKLAFLKPGHKSWTHINQGYRQCFTDLIYYKDQFYVVTKSGKVMFCDISSNRPKLKNVVAPTPIPSDIICSYKFQYQWFVYMYLVKSAGDLLCVARITDVKRTLGFQIFKYQSKWEWIKVKNLRGHTLFLGDYSSSLSLLASDFGNCKPNHIYFTYDKFDIGEFNAEDRSLKSHYYEDICNLGIQQPVWVQATLYMRKATWIQSPFKHQEFLSFRKTRSCV
ncbi:hypothetical protein AQUCO_01700236v1 [Aquilegia coerulea]|uniref:KIB1-4 beta-propeller domain-containing protein n=1 Tax=Aquilegia coerulea TaxID=218851 RepID=A0A2G5DMK5_AQUCA|nr:hypothetical protein AQUCO_01700236v1 [Aquilegia coerulea]